MITASVMRELKKNLSFWEVACVSITKIWSFCKACHRLRHFPPGKHPLRDQLTLNWHKSHRKEYTKFQQKMKHFRNFEHLHSRCSEIILREKIATYGTATFVYEKKIDYVKERNRYTVNNFRRAWVDFACAEIIKAGANQANISYIFKWCWMNCFRLYTSVQHQPFNIHGILVSFIHVFLFRNSYLRILFTIVNWKWRLNNFLFFVLSESVDSDDEKPTRRKADRG